MPSQSSSKQAKQQRIIASGNFTKADMASDISFVYFQLKDLDFKGIDQLIVLLNNQDFVTTTTTGNIMLGSDLLFKGAGEKTPFAGATWAISSATGRNRIVTYTWVKEATQDISAMTSPLSSIAYPDYSVLTAGGGNSNFLTIPITTQLPWFPDKCDIIFRQQIAQSLINVNYIVYGIFGV
jgi:hypothetical protein